MMKILHPLTPFITEELWHEIKERGEKDCVIVAEWPKPGKVDAEILASAETAFEVIANIRNIRNSKQIPPKKELKLAVKTAASALYNHFSPVIKKLAFLNEIEMVNDKVEGAVSFLVKADECFVPLAGEIDVEKEKENLRKELDYTKGFLESIMKKLGNEKFVSNAPAKVLEMENKKKSDAEAKIKAIEEALAKM